MAYKSYHGQELGSRDGQLVYFGRPVGAFPQAMGRGKTFYVDSNVAASDGQSPSTAVATINAAVALCTANQGDTIIVMPSHAETIAAAGDVTIGKAGVSVIGLGYGNQRPTITFSTANTGAFLISAAGVYVENLILKANFLAVAVGIRVTAAEVWLNGLTFKNAGASLNFTNPIKATSTVDNTADGLRVTNCRWTAGADTAGGAFIVTAATIDAMVVWNNFVITGATATAQMISVATGKLLTNADIGWNRLFNLMTANELFISNDGTTNTGIIHNNYVGHADVTGTHDAGWDAGGFRLFNNLSASVDNLSGFVLPAIDVNL